jgi:hypothetical protein
MIVYDNFDKFLSTCKKTKDRIAAIDEIIDQLLVSAAKGALKSHITEYSLNTGQTQIKTVLTSMKDVKDAILFFEQLRNLYISRLPGHGRVVRFVDGKNLRGPCLY